MTQRKRSKKDPRSIRGGPRGDQNVYGLEKETLRLRGIEKKYWNAKSYFITNLRVCGELIEFRIDPGADISIISESTMKN